MVQKYGLATAQTISTVGTTSDIAFTTEGTAVDIEGWSIYSPRCNRGWKDDCCCCKEKGVAVGKLLFGWQLLDEDGENITTTRNTSVFYQ